jgi:hypothetical protein
MIRMPHTCRLQHGDPVLEAQQVPLANFRGTKPIVVTVVSTHLGISQPVRFGSLRACLDRCRHHSMRTLTGGIVWSICSGAE